MRTLDVFRPDRRVVSKTKVQSSRAKPTAHLRDDERKNPRLALARFLAAIAGGDEKEIQRSPYAAAAAVAEARRRLRKEGADPVMRHKPRIDAAERMFCNGIKDERS